MQGLFSILEKLIPLNYDIIVRPHPEYIKRNKKDKDRFEKKTQKKKRNKNVKKKAQR